MVPIGIPLGFYFKMRTRVIELGGEANYNAAGGSKLVPDDADDETDQFSFLVQDYVSLSCAVVPRTLRIP